MTAEAAGNRRLTVWQLDMPSASFLELWREDGSVTRQNRGQQGSRHAKGRRPDQD
jgi:hypothetical protein